MYADLPEKVKQEVYHYLAIHDFRKAKQLHDAYYVQTQQATAITQQAEAA